MTVPAPHDDAREPLRPLLARIWREYLSRHKPAFFTSMLLAGVSGGLTALLLKFLEPAIDLLFGQHAGPVTIWKTVTIPADKVLIAIPLFIIVVAVIRSLSMAGQAALVNRLGHGIVGDIQKQLFSGMIRADLSRLRSQHSGTFVSSVLFDANLVREAFTSGVVNYTQNALMLLGVIVAMMTYIVPKVVDQFDSMGQTLPLLTRLVIGLSDLMRDWGWLMALVIAAVVAAGLIARRREAVRLKLDAWVLRLPLVGRLTRDLHGARMARTLSTMIAAGLPVLEGLTITARTVSNRALRRATEQMAEAVREGGGLSAAMRRAEVFPPILVYMTASGESSGRLEPMLERAADYLEREFSNFTAVMLSLLEPAIIVVMGGIVAVIVLSILLPILQINTLALG
ncbi:type II secretion system F family protein [Brevundimonas sp. UBA5936]|uniref:type II secretion system F family protein n=1 Tax=Brevundimonas sp. UBA5936 TaxID=1946133 RepID=UPI0025B9E375|nr:type II secretion system F family protein [Brevundimonas sp. UBA5936]